MQAEQCSLFLISFVPLFSPSRGWPQATGCPLSWQPWRSVACMCTSHLSHGAVFPCVRVSTPSRTPVSVSVFLDRVRWVWLRTAGASRSSRPGPPCAQAWAQFFIPEGPCADFLMAVGVTLRGEAGPGNWCCRELSGRLWEALQAWPGPPGGSCGHAGNRGGPGLGWGTRAREPQEDVWAPEATAV